MGEEAEPAARRRASGTRPCWLAGAGQHHAAAATKAMSALNGDHPPTPPSCVTQGPSRQLQRMFRFNVSRF